VAELRRGIEGGVDRWSAHHGLEVGGGMAWRGEAVALGQFEEKEGCCPGLVGLCGPHRLNGRLGRLGQKPGKFPFGIK
jgi:hypothetical protein